MILLFIGPPGCGKGTQARLLADGLGLRHLSSGDLLRSHTQRRTAVGVRALEHMQRGELVPNEIVVDLYLDELAGGGAILDGFPREIGQARALDDFLAAKGSGVDHAIEFRIAAETVVERLARRLHCASCGATWNGGPGGDAREGGGCGNCDEGVLAKRADDRPEVVAERFRSYDQQTAPIVDHYRRQGVLSEVHADQPIEVVRGELEKLVSRTPAGRGGN